MLKILLVDKLKNKRIIVFGTGRMCRKIIDEDRIVSLEKVAYFVDNDETKWNSHIYGKLILSPFELQKENKSELFILIASMFYSEIKRQLEEMGFLDGLHFERATAIPYIGTKYECPCCQGKFDVFLDFGIKKRKNVRCPKCLSLERHRLLWLFLKNETNILVEKLSVLHIAPEHCIERNLKGRKNIDYISVDLTSPQAMLKADITKMPFGDNTYDVFICSHVLEHVVEDIKAMKELFRVLKPGGWGVLQIPFDPNQEETIQSLNLSPEKRVRLFGHPEHVRAYGRDFVDKLESINFQVKSCNYPKELGSKAIKKYRLSPRQYVFYCEKL